MIADTERYKLLVVFNKTEAKFPNNSCIHQLFEEQVKRTPDKIAAKYEDQQLTYAQLNVKANQLAHYLQALGVRPETLVGIHLDRSLDMLVAVLGILKAGGAYVPLDPGTLNPGGVGYPKERLAFMLKDTQVAVLLTKEKFVKALPQTEAKTICLDLDSNIIAQSQNNPSSDVTPENLAYVIYTSGTTGKPKGVTIEHQAVLNLSTGLQRQIYDRHNASQLRVSLNAPLGFDASVKQLAMLLHGHTLYIVPENIRADSKAMLDYLKGNGLEVFDCTPTQLKLLRDAGLFDANTALKIVLIGGEAIDRSLWQTLKQIEAINFFNVYGPTECTVDSTFCSLREGPLTPSIGQPMLNKKVYVLDSDLKPVPIGVTGELHIGGVGVARGYLNRPGLTAEKFIRNPFSEDPKARLYKTGDLGRYLPDGNIEFIGRVDNQVKIRGNRIELGEVEATLQQYPGVREAVALVREDVPGDKRLVAYIIPNPERVPTISELRSFLKEKVPDYMLPSIFVMLDKLPLTSNGKIDRLALPAPEMARPQLEGSFVAPQDDLEIQLAKIWEKVLGVQPIGVKDNFFELGGHSLLAVKLFLQIKKTFGKNLPLAALFQAPTVEQFAKILRQEGWSVSWHSLVPIQPKGSRPPLFAIHSLGEGFVFYRYISRYLGLDQPIYGLRYGLAAATSTDTINTEPHLAISRKELIEHYIKEMQTFQPEGPYFLAGVSGGGITAFRMAELLHAQGQKVAVLALIDSRAPGYFPTPLPNTTAWSRYALFWKQKVEAHLSNISQLDPRDRKLYLKDRLNTFTRRSAGGWYFKEIWGMAQKLHEARKVSSPGEGKDAQKALPPKISDAKPVYPGKITLFRASLQNPGFYHEGTKGWEGLAAGGVDVYEITGDHFSIMLEPHVRVLAKHLKDSIDEALAEDASGSDIN